ncbi:pyruvate dehydrogenase (acetyl-transferring) E1 component subunit alpha [Rivihabitans pingtungensis]|jgi:pyruvate dehydrogenase E1 component alpha subunit|uniref:Pyruvate dehydrogenase E1 component subunit alpha n=2 Tax=Rivihabitans pingtungensis TaxID=1054498 RepID=A0A318KXQ9_9NEIS|nr:pyruvate dehydrogenase (acetyl-transferring) E1 component subunit alpha [Rivihabitans pingtungensis]PXX80406.1 pyruvate dehydrogenase E1 component alpha subunit [Rivihabitans pingtungensis]
MIPIAEFRVPYTRFLDAHGHLASPPPDFQPHDLLPVYRAMALTRAFDAKAVALQRTGQLRTYPSSLGQEAVTVGLASVMRAEDVLLPTYRETGAMLWRGVRMQELLLYWSGDERGSDFAGPREDFPIAVPIASQCGHAVGVGFAFQYRRQPRVAVVTLGDGATSKGDFYEAMNTAGAWRLPVVFVVTNNQWAISLPARKQTAAATFAQKAIAAGIPGEQCDGNDILAVRDCIGRALERARVGDGPSLIECVTYRLSDHTTADDARRYRAQDEVSAAWALEPLARLRHFLVDQKLWSKQDEETLLADNQAAVSAAAADYLATPPQALSTLFDYLYAELPADLAAQRQQLLTERGQA